MATPTFADIQNSLLAIQALVNQIRDDLTATMSEVDALMNPVPVPPVPPIVPAPPPVVPPPVVPPVVPNPPPVAPPPAKPVESPDGSTAPIEDAKGNLWNLAPASDTTLGNQVTMNGKLAGYSANVTLLLYFNHTVYQQNNAGGWWSWNGTTWIDAADPRPVVQPLATFLT